MTQIPCDMPRMVLEELRKPPIVSVGYSRPPESSGPHLPHPHLHFSSAAGTTSTTMQAGASIGALPPLVLLHDSHSGEIGYGLELVAKISVRLAPPK